MKQVCLLGASFGTDNRGVAALAAGTINAVAHAFPDGSVFLLDYGRTPTSTAVRCTRGLRDVELVNVRFSKRLLLRNNIARLLALAAIRKIIPSRLWTQRILPRHPELQRLANADLVLSIAGGDSFSDIYGIGRLLYVALPQVLALALGKRLVLLPQTLGPFEGSFARRLASWIMRRAVVVYARDQDSIAAARPLMGATADRLRFSPDMAFALESHISDERLRKANLSSDSSRPLVGLNVSGLLYMGGYTGRNEFGLKSDHRELIRGLIRMFLREGAHVLLVPHVFGSDESSESDVVAGKAIQEELAGEAEGRLHVLEGEYDQHEIKAVIGRCDYFVGARMHACIAALSQCIPATGLAYSRKFRGVFDSVGLADGVLDLRTLDQDAIVAAAAEAFKRRRELRKTLEQGVPAVCGAALCFFNSPVTPCAVREQARAPILA